MNLKARYGRVIFVIFLILVSSGVGIAVELPPKVQKDKYLLRLKKHLNAAEYDRAWPLFEKLEELKKEHGIELPKTLLYFRGVAAFHLGKYKEAEKDLGEYIVSAGKEGKYYNKALTFLTKAEEKPAQIERLRKQEAAEAERLRKEKADEEEKMGVVFVKGGCFEMGDTFFDGIGGDDEKPVHKVCVDDFYMGKYEVTVGEFRAFVNNTGYRTEAERGDGCFYYTGEKWEKDANKNWCDPGFSQTESHPVVCISWNDTQAFIKSLNKALGMNFRLPTEAEWEYAERSGGKKEKWAGTSNESELGAYAWYNDNSGTHPVGQKQPNGLGLYDMSGNVWEWIQDWYGDDYYNHSPRDNPSVMSTV